MRGLDELRSYVISSSKLLNKEGLYALWKKTKKTKDCNAQKKEKA